MSLFNNKKEKQTFQPLFPWGILVTETQSLWLNIFMSKADTRKFVENHFKKPWYKIKKEEGIELVPLKVEILN